MQATASNVPGSTSNALASARSNETRSATPSSAARARARGTKTSLMSTPRPRIPCLRAQVQSISPLPLARSSSRWPRCHRHSSPTRASFSSVNGLRIR